MLLGIWKNVEELEENINIDELRAILEAAQRREHRKNKFMAALKGIDLDSQSNESAREAFERVKLSALAKSQGKTTDEIEFNALGIDIETD